MAREHNFSGLNLLLTCLFAIIIVSESTETYLQWLEALDGILKIPPEPSTESFEFAIQLNITTDSGYSQCNPSENLGLSCQNVSCTNAAPQSLSLYEVKHKYDGEKSKDAEPNAMESICGIAVTSQGDSRIIFSNVIHKANESEFCDFKQAQPSLNISVQPGNDGYTLLFGTKVSNLGPSRYVFYSTIL